MTTSTRLAELPPVDEQERAVRLRVRLLELEADEHVRARGERELERRHEEADAGRTAGQARGEVARGPARGVEPGQVPALALAEQASFVHHAAHLVREAVFAIVSLVGDL